MRYKSTRDSAVTASFEEALCSGYAPDGGLFVPDHLPSINAEDHLIPWSKLPFHVLAYEVLRMFISPDEVSDAQLVKVCEDSFVFDIDGETVPVKKLGPSAFIAELFMGPTFCFKDFGMRPVINLLSLFATVRNRPMTLLVSTTGDTGPAAVHAISDADNPLLTLLVHYPEGQISEFQRRQLTTVESKCVKVAAFQGGGDDMDEPIKRILLSSRGGNGGGGRSFGGVNSYNIGRPLMQMVHFVWTYLRVVEQLGVTPGDESCKVDIVLPTGAMGNIIGGYMAKNIGVPLGKLCAGVNINDITHRVMEKGEFHKKSIQRTLSEAINIEVPYNFERMLFYLTGGDHALVQKWMLTMEKTQKLDLDASWLDRLQEQFCSARVTDEEMCDTLRQMSKEFDYVADPHTSVAIAAAEKLGYSFHLPLARPVAILATASPCKFQESVTVALGKEGWEKWKESHFPSRAHIIMSKEETAPSLYRYREGASLSEVQLEWENAALQIVGSHF